MFIVPSQFDLYTQKIYRQRETSSYTASDANLVANEAINQEIEKQEEQIYNYTHELNKTFQEKARKELQQKIDYYKERKQTLLEFRQKFANVYNRIEKPEDNKLKNEYIEIKTAINDLKNINENDKETSKLESKFSKEFSENQKEEDKKIEDRIKDLEQFLKKHPSIERALNKEIQKIVSEARKQTKRPFMLDENQNEIKEEKDSRLETIKDYNRLQGKYEFKTTKNFNPAKAVVKGKETIEKLIKVENQLTQIQETIQKIDRNRYPKTFDMLLKMKATKIKEQLNFNRQLDNLEFEKLKTQVEEAKQKELSQKEHQENLTRYMFLSYQLEKALNENPNNIEQINDLKAQLNTITGLEESEKKAQELAGKQKYTNEKFDKKIENEIKQEEKDKQKELEQMAYKQLRQRAIEELGEQGLEQQKVMLNGDLRHTGPTSEEIIREKMKEIKERDQRKKIIEEKQEELLTQMVKDDFRKDNINQEIGQEDLEVKKEEIENLTSLSADEVALRRAQEEGYLEGVDLSNLKPYERDALEAQKRIDEELLRNLKAFKALQKEYNDIKAQERIQIVSEAVMNQYMEKEGRAL